ncbi:MAG: stage III sporulation protein AD [Firmicutes bacterium]|nr:stage III sporulation protein AD [Bacillota bacterium]
MDLLRVLGVAILTTFAVLLLKPTRPEIAAILGVAGGIIVIMLVINSLSGVIESITSIVDRTGIRNETFSALLKIIGIGYLTEFAAGICQDGGSSSMANKVILAGKVVILVLALPIISNLIDIVIGIVP